MTNVSQASEHRAGDVYYGIGENVKALLKRKNLKQKDLGPILGISESAASLKANGHSPWTAYEVLVVAERLDATIGMMYGTEPLPRPTHPSGAAGRIRHFVLPDTDVVHPLGLEPRTHWIRDNVTPISRPVNRTGHTHPRSRGAR